MLISTENETSKPSSNSTWGSLHYTRERHESNLPLINQLLIKWNDKTGFSSPGRATVQNSNPPANILWACIIGMIVWVFANGPGDQGSIPGWVIPKTQKWYLIAPLLNTQHYKVWIRLKWSSPGKEVVLFPYTYIYITHIYFNSVG